MAKQPGIVLYRENYQNVRGVLTQAQKGDLLDALMDGAYPGDDQLVTMAFNIFDAAIKRTEEKYQATCDRNREAARKRWEQMREKADAYDRIQADADGCERIQADAIKTKTKTQTQIETNIPTGKKVFTPPSADEVRSYCQEQGYGIDPERFIDYYTARGWELKPGQKMKDWKASVRTWAKNQKERGWDNDIRGSRPENRIPGQRDQYDDL